MNQVIKTQDLPVTYRYHADYKTFKTRFDILSSMYEKMKSTDKFTAEELDLFKNQVLTVNIAMVLASFGCEHINGAKVIDAFEKLAALRKQIPAPLDSLDARIKFIERLSTIRRNSLAIFNNQTIDCNTRVADLDVIITYATQ